MAGCDGTRSMDRERFKNRAKAARLQAETHEVIPWVAQLLGHATL